MKEYISDELPDIETVRDEQRLQAEPGVGSGPAKYLSGNVSEEKNCRDNNNQAFHRSGQRRAKRHRYLAVIRHDLKRSIKAVWGNQRSVTTRAAANDGQDLLLEKGAGPPFSAAPE